MKAKGKRLLLTQAVLASTLFITSLGYADTYGPGSSAGPQATSATSDNIIQILGGNALTAGQILGTNADAVQLDSANGQVIVDANNQVYGINAIETLGAGAQAIGINITGNNGVVTIGKYSGIDALNTKASSDGIYVDATGAAITNSGTIRSHHSTIAVASGADALLRNNATGVLTGTSEQQRATVQVNSGATSGTTIINAGRIQAFNKQSALNIDGDINLLQNSGTIAADNPTNGTIYLNGAVTIANGFSNNGNIINANGKAAIDLRDAAVSFTQNSGTISGNVFLAETDSMGGEHVFTMNGGMIAGDVLASTSAGVNYDLQLNGGTIAGTLALGTSQNTINLAGTQVNTIDGSQFYTPHIYHVTGGGFNALIGNGANDTLNIDSSFTSNGIITNVGWIYVNHAGTVFTANLPIRNVEYLFVDANATAIFNGVVEGSPSYGEVENEGRLIANTQMLFSYGDMKNYEGGNVIINKNGLIEVDYGYNGHPGSTLSFQLTPTHYGQLINGVVAHGDIILQKDSFIKPLLVAGDFFPAGRTYDVIVANHVNSGVSNFGLVKDDSTLIQPSSAILYLTKEVHAGPPESLRLTIHRRSYASYSTMDSTWGIANALDFLAQGEGPSSTDLLSLLGHLDVNASGASLQSDMQSLVPPFNYGLVTGSHLGMEWVFDGLVTRLQDLQWYGKLGGANYGDGQGNYGSWIQVLGGHASQADRHDVDGYRVNGAGLAIGMDWGYNDCLTFGVAASYIKMNVNGEANAPKDQAIQSYQGTLYGWYEPYNGIFVDGIFGYAHEEIDANRVITASTLRTAAQADFHGNEYGALLDLGYNFTKGSKYFTAPVIRFKYLRLDLEDYTEKGAGDLNLHVSNKPLNEFAGGLGLRLGMLTEAYGTTLIPELSLMGLYDFKIDREETVASFVGGSASFITPGATPGKAIFDLGLGLHAYMSADTVLTFKYNFEMREKYFSNAGYVKYYYRWG